MLRHGNSLRTAFWLAAFALVLKAALPLIASGAAASAGLHLVEICTTYGVRTVVGDNRTGAPLPDSDPAQHAADSGCAAGAASQLTASPPAPSVALRAPPFLASPDTPRPAPAPHDTTRRWQALHHRGPPQAAPLA